MKKFAIILLLTINIGQNAWSKVTIGASLTDMASIAAAIGGERVDVFAIARNNADPHSVEVLPSYMVKVARADLYLKVGLSLDQWADQIIQGARNSKLKIVDCSGGIQTLEKPVGKVDASQGDVHPEGNPHYWLDPTNGLIIAETIARALIEIDPTGKSIFETNLKKFHERLQEQITTLQNGFAHLAEHNVITYHSSWAYLANAFMLNIVAKIEPVPGIPPTAKHLAQLVRTIREQKVRAVIQEPYFSDDGAKYLSRETGIKVIKIAPSCDDANSEAYFNHFQAILRAFQAAE